MCNFNVRNLNVLMGRSTSPKAREGVQNTINVIEHIDELVSKVDSQAKEFLSVKIHEDKNGHLKPITRKRLENNVLLVAKINKALAILKGIDERSWLILEMYAQTGNPVYGTQPEAKKPKRNIALRFWDYIKYKIKYKIMF